MNTQVVSKVSWRFLLVINLICSIGCGGGGDGGGGAADTFPILTAMSISPTSAPVGTIDFPLDVDFHYEDPGGDLNGGACYASLEGDRFSASLGESFKGSISGRSVCRIRINLGYSSGVKKISFWVVDGRGSRSNTLEADFTQEWTRQWQSSPYGGVLDEGRAIVLDRSNNVYAAAAMRGNMDGYVNTHPQTFDIYITKFDPSGRKLWTGHLDSAPRGVNGDDVPTAIAVDSGNNVYVTGKTNGDLEGNVSGGVNNIFLAKLDSSGNKLWTRFLGVGQGNGIFIDQADNIFLAGTVDGDPDGNIDAGPTDALLMKLSPDGATIWTRLYGTPAAMDCGLGVALDSQGNIFLAGTTDGTSVFIPGTASLIKYDASGTFQWTQTLPVYTTVLSIAMDNNDNIYLTGESNGDIDGNAGIGNWDIFLAKLDSSGIRQWIRIVGSRNNDAGRGVVVDEFDNIYLTGNRWNQVCLYKFDSSGNNLLSYHTEIFRGGTGYGIAKDTNNYIYITGASGPSLTELSIEGAFILKYDMNGVRQ